ncbi:MAG: LamG-like jellyroll fold domain-containing protein [Verrucomicrobiota bacterium]
MAKLHIYLAVLCLCLGTTLAVAEPSGALVGCWRFDGGDGKTVRDQSPRNNSGVIEKGVLRKEKNTTSLELDGWGSHVLIRETTPFGFGDKITATLWVKASELRNNTPLFGQPHTNDGWTTPMFGMYASDGRIIFGLWGDKGSSKALVETTREFPLDAWTFLVGTYDGTTTRLFINGVLNSEKPHTGRIFNNGQPLILGKGLGDTKPPFKGRIGELRLYARSFTAEEVRALFEQTKTAYDLSSPAAQAAARFKDGIVIVETHGSSPESSKPWRANPTRLLELLDGYKPTGAAVKTDAYGGRVDRPRVKASGFFYTIRIEGRHWLIDPDGCRYFNKAINTVREPRNVAANFGSAEQWAEVVTDQLRTNGFNGLGNGAPSRLQAAKSPLVWVLRKDFMFAFAREKKLTQPASGTQGFMGMCMPIFHPDFEAFCDRFGQDLAKTANDPNLLGIMTDNEIQCSPHLLDRYLALDVSNPDLKPNHDAAAAWLTARRGSANPDAATLRDRYEFIAYAFERYYRIVTKAIRKYDSHHLYLGSRLNYHEGEFDNPWLWKAMAPYHDVVSINYYGYWGPQAKQLAEWEAWAGKPIIFTEWYAKAMDVPGLANTHGAGWLVHTQEDRARYYQHFVLNALELKNVVGFHFFKYLDDPKESVALDAAGGANKGMFDLEGRPHLPLLERARAVNREAYSLIDFFDARNR